MQNSFDADVIIIGAGIAGGFVANRLAKRGVKVLVLEGGPNITRADLHAKYLKTRSYGPTALDPISEFAPTTNSDDVSAYLINTGSASYNVSMTKCVGGTTWHWTGYCERFRDVEFQLKSTYGIGVDWPISYGELEPYYCQAEEEMGVSAPSGDATSFRRSKPMPMSDFEWPYFYKHLQKTLAPQGLNIETGGFARNTKNYDGRPACRGNNTCWPLCPIGAQYNGIVHIDKARAQGVEVRDRSLTVSLELDDTGKISAAIYRKPDGSLLKVRAKMFVLAANGMESTKLLLASASESHPSGIGNSSNQVGRNFMDHATVQTTTMAKYPVFPGRGPMAFGWISGIDDGVFRRDRASGSLNFENRMNVDVITGDVLRDKLKGDVLEREIKYRALRSFSLFSLIEMLPNSDSRITLDWQQRDSAGQPRMRVNLNIDSYTSRTLDVMAKTQRDVAAKIEVVKSKTVKSAYFGNHPMGATRMGADRRSSVVDPQCRSHDHPNLYVASSSVFPTSGGSGGPTLTIAALALRIADTIVADLKK